MADIDHNYMKRCDSQGTCRASLLIYPGELAEAYGEVNGTRSGLHRLCTRVRGLVIIFQLCESRILKRKQRCDP